MTRYPFDEFDRTREKVNGPDSVTSLNGTPMFQWFVIRCGSKNRHQKDMWGKEIGLRAQNALLEFYSSNSIFNIIGDTCMIIQEERQSTL